VCDASVVNMGWCVIKGVMPIGLVCDKGVMPIGLVCDKGLTTKGRAMCNESVIYHE
jgi:hypothetical protein